MKGTNKLDKNKLEKVFGGAKPMKGQVYEFHCKRCDRTWTKRTESPSNEHGCPYCKWWFMKGKGNLDSEGNLIYEHECVEYDPKPKN